MTYIKLFFILYFISAVFLFILKRRGKPPMLIPGDLYRRVGNIKIYIPLASSLVITLILFALLNKYIK